jgi:hypothetical protein
MKIFADVGDSGASDITPKEHAADPQYSTKDVIDEICGIAHRRSAGDWRAEGADDGNEASQDYGPPAILFVEFVSSLEMAPAEKQRIFAPVKCWTGGASDPVAQLVTGNGAKDTWEKQPAKRDYLLAGEDAGGDEQGIARQKEPNEEACLHKDDGAYKGGASPTD